MQCKEVAEVIEQEGFSPLPDAARGHVAGCAACSALIADFERIVELAHEIPAEVEPPSRVWISLRARLEAEKIISEPDYVVQTQSAPWWQGFGQLIRGRMLATAVVAVLVVAAGYFQIHQSPTGLTPTATTTEESRPLSAGIVAEPFAETATTLDQEERNIAPVEPASLTAGTSQVDNALRENLVKLNAFIKECRKRLQEDPHDQMARDYLSAAYQQKAEILAAMMERGRSVN
jgi:hypothetical protein